MLARISIVIHPTPCSGYRVQVSGWSVEHRPVWVRVIPLDMPQGDQLSPGEVLRLTALALLAQTGGGDYGTE